MNDPSARRRRPSTDGRRCIDHDLTVVIPTLGRPLLAQCLAALAGGRVLPARTVVVHQGSDEDTPELCEEFNRTRLECLYVPRPHERGVGAATNVGIAAADTPFVAVTHDDCVVDAGWVERTVENLRHQPRTIFTGQVLPGGPGRVPSTNERRTPQTYQRPPIDRDVLFPACMGCSVEVHHEVGPFSDSPELRLAAEDNEWAYRAFLSGFVIHHDPAMIVTHLDWRSVGDMVALERRYARAQGAFYGMYLRKGDRFVFRRTLYDLKRFGKRAIRGIGGRDLSRVRLGGLQATEMVRGMATGLTGGGIATHKDELQPAADGRSAE